MEVGRFIENLLVDGILECPSKESPVVESSEVLSYDDKEYATMIVETDQLGGMHGHPGTQLLGDHGSNGINVSTNIVVVTGCTNSESHLTRKMLIFTTTMLTHWISHRHPQLITTKTIKKSTMRRIAMHCLSKRGNPSHITT